MSAGRLAAVLTTPLLFLSLLKTFQLAKAQDTLIEVNFDEGRPARSSVYLFDSSSGDVFSLYQADPTVPLLFQISEVGHVTSTQEIEYEIGKTNKYDLTVLQRPRGETLGGIAITLRITILDVNNFHPVFQLSQGEHYEGFVKEGTAENTIVEGLEQCHATDRDTSGIRGYSIISGNEKGYFKVETVQIGSGVTSRKFLVLKTTGKPIVRDDNNPYIMLTVQVTDGGNPSHSGTANIRVNVEDANDQTPVFESSQYRETIAENTPIQTSVLRVRATDKDDGTNGGIYYYMKNPVNSYFTIDAITGVIRVAKTLDYNARDKHTLYISARDRGDPPRTSAEATVEISLRENIQGWPLPDSADPKENTKPYFPQSRYTFSIREDFPPKGALLVMRAADNDPIGPNKRLRYSLSGNGVSKFAIDPESGVVTLTDSVDYENTPNNHVYDLTVTATDQGPGSLSATTQLLIEIQDVDENKNSPRFDPQQAILEISENLKQNSLVTTVSATDSDSVGNPSSPDGKVVYSIVGGTGLGVFRVDSNTGEVKVAVPSLDREGTSQYTLVVKASDNATFPRSSRLFLMINLLDEDDNFPYFSQPIYIAQVPENQPSGTFVTVVVGRDADEGFNPSYTVITPGVPYKIEPSTGVIRTSKSLDQSELSTRELQVIVRVSTAGSKTADGQVNITVISKVNRPPVFKNTPYSVKVPEEMGPLPNLFCIAAVDSLSRPVQYTLAPGADGLFEVDKDSGRLHTKNSFNYENVDRYNLRIEARTSSVQEVASASLTVEVTEEKDLPKFSSDSYQLTVDESAAPGTTLAPGLLIIDSDTSSDQFDCSMEAITSLHTLYNFEVTQQSGRCFLRVQAGGKLDAHLASKYTFNVRATDRNFRNMFATAQVEVNVIDVNDHKPEFLQESYWLSVPSSTPAGSSLVTVQAEDMDIGTNAQVRYELLRQENSERFILNDNNQLSTASTLTPNVRYQLLIRASDSATRNPSSAQVPVYVSVYSPSESPIVFDKSSYNQNLPEDSSANTLVFTAKATRSGSSSGITYELVGGYKQIGEAMFSIKPDTGQVYLIKKLDFETKSYFPIAVRAKYSGGAIELASEVVAKVTIVDVNDNGPRFAFHESSKTVVIDSFSAKDTQLVQARALDADSGSLGEVTYGIDGGKSTSNLPFNINVKTGMIFATREILYTQGSSYIIIVVATDGATDGSQKIQKFTVNVQVLDTPRPPSFPQKTYSAPVTETAGVGDTVTTVRAVYSKPNAFLKYTFVSGNEDNTFCVNGFGIISVAKSLDREKVAGYTLGMRVTLGQHVDDTTVYVNLTDINDDAPHFTSAIYRRSIKEGLAEDTEILPPVIAVDHDFGSNGKILYSILSGVHPDWDKYFNIDSATGKITTKMTLDYETHKSHTLFIRAEDNGSPKRLSGMAQVDIDVIDRNDNSPVFAAAFYRAKISLGAVKGTSVLQVHATDLDSGQNGQITYSIIQGNEEEAFTINEQGVILVDKSLTTVAADKFSLKVEARDKNASPRSGSVTVEINVYLPDGPPMFVVSPVTVYVKEGVPANHRVAGVKAATSEALTYTLLSGNEAGMFRINPSTGSLDATRELDYEERRRYELKIEARDTRDRSAMVELIIIVVNINDNKPTFVDIVDGQIDRKAIGTCSPTDIAEGEVITRLGAFDRDGDEITFIVPDDVKDLFKIDSRGVVTAKKPIEDLPKIYPFNVKALDNGEPPQETDVKVRLVFVHYRPDQKHVRVNVREDTPTGSVIATVRRYFPNGIVSLLLPEKANFSVRANGDVILLTPLDYESQQFHRMTVREELGNQTNDVDVEVVVLDVNDNRPIWMEQERLARVNTNSRAGAQVYQLEARDEDDGSSGLVGYQLKSPSNDAKRKRRSPPQHPFTINPKTRQMEVAGSLKDQRYDLDVFAFDYGIPRLTSDTITLNVDGSAAGQLPPRFSKVSYHFMVSEDAKYLSLVGIILARSISGARLDYKIVSGNVGDKFIAMGDGRILLNSLLDFERDQTQYNLKVKATEQIPDGLDSTVDVKIDVINANDHFPYFDQQLYSVQIPESTAVGVLVQEVTAKDCDCLSSCTCSPGFLTYSIEPSKEQGGKFYIDPATGKISVSVALDYEDQRYHLLKVYATDKGKKSFQGLCFVNVTLTNVNDNRPTFLKSAYEFRVAEGAATGESLAIVVAVDADGDAVTYSKAGGALQFSVDQSTGVITLNSALDPNKNQYTLQVMAKDSGGLTSTVSVTFNVADANNNVPQFTNCGTVSIRENDPRDTKITQLTATDADRGQNGQITYSIEDASSQTLFSIEPRTGVVRSLTSLDRENKDSYNAIIKAEDGSSKQDESERLLWYCYLTINVEDVNDNRPYFLAAKYFGSVFSSAPNGSNILTVQATDADSGSNAKIKYALLDSAGGLFRLDSSGILRTNTNPARLQLETGKKLLLEVSAKDVESIAGTQPGKPTKYTTQIEILVSNEEPPKFSQQVYTASINENMETGSTVTRITATSSTGAEISYENVDTNPRAKILFRVQPDGYIITGDRPDYERGTTYNMQFAAKDKKTLLYSTVKVVINIIDVNDVSPAFLLAINTRNARVLENKPAPTKVISMKAIDDDGSEPHRRVTYEMKDNPNFQIDASTGMITTKTTLDREVTPKYDVEVTAKDRVNKESAILYITVVDQNDQPPVFAPKSYAISVPEDSPIGTSVLDIYATDADVGENAKITYFISKGDPEGKFSIVTSPVKGELVVNGKLDFETKSSYTLEVTATDGKFSDTAVVTVTIQDVNDLPPVFSSPLYESRIQENTGPGAGVVMVTASDIDSPTISFSLDDRGKDYFQITPIRASGPGNVWVGDIRTGSKQLDREESPVKVFTVIANDGKHTAQAEIRVNLTDVNDNAPRFPASPYIGYVEENKPSGTSVMYIQAVDDDDPLAGGNAKLSYELTDSAGDKFSIDPLSGLIKTKVTFDREQTPNKFKVRVKATDAGNPRLSASVDGIIHVSDANDHKPKFTEKFYRGSVAENAPPGYSVLRVTATDEDVGPNAEFEFVVVQGNDPHAFYIDPFNGTVLVSGILDYEKKKEYTITLTVADRGMPPLQGDETAYVVIEILDANDNAPEFIPKIYNASVLEDVGARQPVLTVTAVDRDSGPNGNFTFAIDPRSDPDDAFTIEPNPNNASIGIIRTRVPLDQEKTPSFHLKVTATDAGGLQGEGEVRINVIDVNDNGPWFVPPFFVGQIKEGVSARQFVTKLKAYDPDAFVKDQVITFSIYNGTVGENFKLDPVSVTNESVDLHSYGVFDREAAPVWKIGIEAVDNVGPKPQKNFTYVYVDVLDVNDNAPKDGSLLIIVNAYDGNFTGGVIGKPYYQDDDFDGDENTYELNPQSPGSYFRVNEGNGDITAAPMIPMGEYNLKIRVTEKKDSPSTVTSSVRVLVRRIDKEAVDNGVAVEFTDMRKVGYFVGDYYKGFEDVLASTLGVPTGDIKIFSVQKAHDNGLAVVVFFTVAAKDSYMPHWDVVSKLVDAKKPLESLGLKVSRLGMDECSKGNVGQSVGVAKNILVRSSNFSVASGDYGKVPAPASSLTIVSIDILPKCLYEAVFPPEKRCKPHNPCLHGGKCYETVPDCPGFVCKCPTGYHGPLCEMTTRTFYGNSYIWLPKLMTYSLSDLEFEFMTKTADGLLVYQGPEREGANNGLKDFIAVVLRGGRVELFVSLGLDPVTVKMDKGPRLDDGEWHTVQVLRNMKDIEIIIDRCSTALLEHKPDGTVVENRKSCHVYGRMLGRSVFLDGFGPLQIGGVSNPNMDFPDIPYTGFKGCVRNIKDNHNLYDLKNPLKVVNAPEGCQLASACPECKNDGYCEPLMARDSICVCNPGYSGKHCDGRGKASYYLASSFTEYLVAARRRRREVVPPPTEIFNRFYTTLALQVKLDEDATNVVVFLASNRMGTEFQRVDVKDSKIRYVLRLGARMLVLSFPQLNVTDGVYHSVIVRRHGDYAIMQLDYSGYVIGSLHSQRTLLDMSGGEIFSGGLPNITIVRIIEAIVENDGSAVISTNVRNDGDGYAADVGGVHVRNLQLSGPLNLVSRKRRASGTVSVLGDFGGCIAGTSVNGANMESDPSIKVHRQNVLDGCPCLSNFCANGGTCVDAMPPYCICAPGWTGPLCTIVVTAPPVGERGTPFMHPAVIAIILVVMLAIFIIMGAVILKRRPEPVVVYADSTDTGHVHDNVRLYHDDGGGEEDNLGYDITKLMKYTYIETTIAPPSVAPSKASEDKISTSSDQPLLQGRPPDAVFGLTGKEPGPKMPKYMEGDDVGDFITTRVKITDREVFLAVDELHIYRYEGDDTDVDDLSEIEPDEEDEEYEQEFDFLKQWGPKFDKLAKLYEDVDE
uniref:Cadherin 1 n=1 Tax=Nematostella vectensis TaxID=45351 RepID=A0A4Y6A8A5_NEMVE|nr:cadherin 1 [Nematostella vectensis]